MAEHERYPAVGAPLIQAVLYADLLERWESGYRFVASSLPGHLIQVMIEGRTMPMAGDTT